MPRPVRTTSIRGIERGNFMTNALIVFYICLAVYFVALGIFVLIKKIRAKKAFDKEMKEHELEGNDNEEKPQ